MHMWYSDGYPEEIQDGQGNITEASLRASVVDMTWAVTESHMQKGLALGLMLCHHHQEIHLCLWTCKWNLIRRCSVHVRRGNRPGSSAGTQGPRPWGQEPECAVLLAWPPGAHKHMPRADCGPAELRGGSWPGTWTQTGASSSSRSSGGRGHEHRERRSNTGTLGGSPAHGSPSELRPQVLVQILPL